MRHPITIELPDMLAFTLTVEAPERHAERVEEARIWVQNALRSEDGLAGCIGMSADKPARLEALVDAVLYALQEHDPQDLSVALVLGHLLCRKDDLYPGG